MKFQTFFAHGQRPTGLFGYNLLKGDDGFKRMAEDALIRSNKIVAKVVAAKSDEELAKTVKRLDKLSDILCSVIDSAQLIQLVHPQHQIRNDAMNAFKKLSSYLNSLNTNHHLYSRLSLLLKNKDISRHLCSNERIVGELLLKDFEKSGINMSVKDKQEYVQLHDKILDLGNCFMNYQSDQSILLKDLPGLVNDQEFLKVDADSHLAHSILHKSANERVRRDVYMIMNQGSIQQIQVLEKLLKTRSDLAKLLNEKSYAHMFLKDKMVKSPGKIRLVM
jgi:intermediate peptidase